MANDGHLLVIVSIVRPPRRVAFHVFSTPPVRRRYGADTSLEGHAVARMMEEHNHAHPLSSDGEPPEASPARGSTSTESELEPLWEGLQEAVRANVKREQYETWFRRTALCSIDDETVRIAVQNGFTRDWLQDYYLDVLERAVDAVVGSPRRIEFVVDPELRLRSSSRSGEPAAPEPSPQAPVPPASAPAAAAAASASNSRPRSRLMESSDVSLHPKHVFENFVVGPCNRFAHAASVGVSENPGETYNPFFLHGSVGLGKTHLLQSLCHAILERQPEAGILYLSCETFVNHFISALENGDLQKFRNNYRNVDVLVVDDIHLLANKERTQEEFFHTFNTLYNAGKQIVLSSDSPPKDIPTLESRLVSRFKWGLVTEIEPPCYETRMAILKRKSRERGRELPDEVARLLAERIDTNIRELEGAVTKIIGFAGLSGQEITVELARDCLRELFVGRRTAPSMEDILRVVTERFGVKLSDLQSRKRTQVIAFPRQIGMYLARKITRMSLEEIGGYFGGRDHSTVLYAVQKVTKLAGDDPKTQDLLGELIAQLQHPE